MLWLTPVLWHLVYPLCGSEHCLSWEADRVHLGKKRAFFFVGQSVWYISTVSCDRQCCSGPGFYWFFFPPSLLSVVGRGALKHFTAVTELYFSFSSAGVRLVCFEAVTRWTRTHDCFSSWWTGSLIFMIKISIFPLCPHSVLVSILSDSNKAPVASYLYSTHGIHVFIHWLSTSFYLFQSTSLINSIELDGSCFSKKSILILVIRVLTLFIFMCIVLYFSVFPLLCLLLLFLSYFLLDYLTI